MRKFVEIFIILLMLNSAAYAENIKVVALSHFSTSDPKPVFHVEVIEPFFLPHGELLSYGAVISGLVTRIEPPKRGKRNAYFEFVPTLIEYNGVKREFDHPAYGAKVVGYSPIDPIKLLDTTTKKVANFAFKGAGFGISFVQGVATAQDGERIKSGVIKTYKDSPLSYLEVGKELDIDKGDILILKIKKLK